MSGQETTIAEAISEIFLSLIEKIHTVLPGIIESYDYTTQKAKVSPATRKIFRDGTEVDMPVITGVPVIFPRSSKFSLTWPLEKGDTVLLLFAERSIDEWLKRGGKVTPNIIRKFALSDCIAIPGLYPFNQTSVADNNEDAKISLSNTKITLKQNGDVEIEGDNIKLGSSVKKLVNEDFKSIYDSHVHNFTAAPSGTFSTSTPALLAGTVSSTPVGSAPATYDGSMPSSNLTSKTKAE